MIPPHHPFEPNKKADPQGIQFYQLPREEKLKADVDTLTQSSQKDPLDRDSSSHMSLIVRNALKADKSLLQKKRDPTATPLQQ